MDCVALSVNPLKGRAVKCYNTWPSRSKPTFLISDIQALWRSGLSARVPECQKLKMVGYACMATLNTWKCNHMTPLRFDGLILRSRVVYRITLDALADFGMLSHHPLLEAACDALRAKGRVRFSLLRASKRASDQNSLSKVRKVSLFSWFRRTRTYVRTFEGCIILY